MFLASLSPSAVMILASFGLEEHDLCNFCLLYAFG